MPSPGDLQFRGPKPRDARGSARPTTATNLTQKLYASDQNPGRDSRAAPSNSSVPTIATANLRRAQYSLSVYGNGIFFSPRQ